MRDHGGTAATEEGFHVDVQSLLRFLDKEKWVILFVGLVLGGISCVWILGLPKVYEAKATLEYDPNPPRPMRGDIQDVADPVGDFWASREFFQTQNEVIASRTVCERVVDKLSLHRDPSFMQVPSKERARWTGASKQEAAALLTTLLRVEQHKESRIVEIRYSDVNPTRARLIVNTVADSYIQKTISDRLGTTIEAVDWMNAQLVKLKGQLDESELALHSFKEEHNILSLSMEDKQNIVAGRIARLNEALTDAQTRRIEQASRLAQLEEAARVEGSVAHSPDFDGNEALAALRARAQERAAERTALAVRFGPNHPDIKSLDAELSLITTQLNDGIRGLVESARRNLLAAQDAERQIHAALDMENQAGIELNLREIEYSRLNRATQNNEKLYGVLLERTTEANLTKLLRISPVRMLDTAMQPEKPVSPRIPILIPLASVVSMLLGLLAGFLHWRLDQTIRSVETAEAMGLTVVGVTPTLADDAAVRRRIRKRSRRSDETLDQRDLFVHAHPRSVAAECYRTLRTNLTFMSADRQLRALVVTSAQPREGKTTVAVGLGTAIAQSGKRVLLIDTDLRRPRVHRTFGITNGAGVTSILVGDATLQEAAQPTLVPNLHVLPSGPVPPNPSELLHSARFRELLAHAREEYDLTILDSPPVAAVTDAAIIAHCVDGALFVINAGSSTRSGVSIALRHLRDAGVRMVGVVMNGIDFNKRGYGYGYGYGSGYGNAYYQYYSAYENESDNEPGDGGGVDSNASQPASRA